MADLGIALSSMAEDYYVVLAVARDATPQDIKRAFREIARKCHPDVAGTDPASEEQFKNARKAYETLMDPVARARYDRRAERQAPPPGGSFFDAFYRATGARQEERATGARQEERAEGPRPARDGMNESTVTGRMRMPNRSGGGSGAGSGGSASRSPGNAVTLDDLFNDFGFGGGRVNPGRPTESPPPRPASQAAPPPRPLQGEDVHVDLEVAAVVARDGGSTTAVYSRMQRADSWRPGAADAGLVRVQDIADVRIVPNTIAGAVLRERGLGHAGAYGGAYGDLVVTVKIAGPRPEPEIVSAGPTVDLGIVEALLGGRVSLVTPQGRIWLTIPPGTSSGVQLRLKGKGPAGGDWLVTTRILVPRELDAESRKLIEAFALLNPTVADDQAP